MLYPNSPGVNAGVQGGFTMPRSARTSPGSGLGRGIRSAAPIRNSPPCKSVLARSRRSRDRARLAALRSHERALEKRLSAPGRLDTILRLRNSLRDDAQRRAAANRHKIAQAIGGVATTVISEVSRSSSPSDQILPPTNDTESSLRRCSPGTDPCHSPTAQHPTDKCKTRVLRGKERSSSAVSAVPSPDLIRVVLIVDRGFGVTVTSRFGDVLLSIGPESAVPQRISPPNYPVATAYVRTDPPPNRQSTIENRQSVKPRRATRERRRAPRR